MSDKYLAQKLVIRNKYRVERQKRAMASDRLSRAVSQVAKIRRDELTAYSDPFTKACGGECVEVIAQHADKQVREVLASYGFTPMSYMATLRNRVTEKWIFFYNCGDAHVEHLVEEDSGIA